MQMHIFLALKSAIESLANSGEVVIRNRYVRCHAKNLNSPYVSHQTVTFSRETRYESSVTVSNTRYALKLYSIGVDVGPHPDIHPSTKAKHTLIWAGGLIPVEMLEKLRHRLAHLGMGRSFYVPPEVSVVHVEVGVRIVERWEGKNPVFVPRTSPADSDPTPIEDGVGVLAPLPLLPEGC